MIKLIQPEVKQTICDISGKELTTNPERGKNVLGGSIHLNCSYGSEFDGFNQTHSSVLHIDDGILMEMLLEAAKKYNNLELIKKLDQVAS